MQAETTTAAWMIELCKTMKRTHGKKKETKMYIDFVINE
jgi:hypothetical protein